MGDKITKIGSLPAFQGLENDVLAIISGKINDRNYKKGMILLMEGEPGDHVYFVYSGKIKVTVSSEDGQEKILQIAQSGDIIGEVVAFDKGPYPITAEAIENSSVGMLSVNDALLFIENHPALAINLLKMMSKRLRQLQRQIKNLALKDAYGRLASRLFKLARDHGQSGPDGVLIGVALTHQELANFIGTSRETVSRILREFEKTKIISVNRQQITILNDKKLREWM